MITMYNWMEDLFPINRSITGEGLRETLQYLNKLLPEMKINAVKSRTKVFDWEVPDEWKINQAYIENESGERVVDFADNNLHIVGYSIPKDEWLDLSELEEHLHSLPKQPNAIPYVTSYYNRNWGFCIEHSKREGLKQGKYHVVIDSKIFSGELNYGEVIIHGREKKEILLSTYICHPSMANNELSGPVVTTALAQWLTEQTDLRYTYRILFIPETIGSITYLSQHYELLKKNVIAGFVLTCVGDNQTYSYVPSRLRGTLSDQVAQHVLHHIYPKYKKYTFLDRGSDERQYCSPGIDLPIASVMRSKYHEYTEYHTSLDNLEFVSDEGLNGSLCVYKKMIMAIEKNCWLMTTTYCEPQLGKRDLYPKFTNLNTQKTSTIANLLAYADGEKSLLDIAEIIDTPVWELYPISELLIEKGLLSVKHCSPH